MQKSAILYNKFKNMFFVGEGDSVITSAGQILPHKHSTRKQIKPKIKGKKGPNKS